MSAPGFYIQAAKILDKLALKKTTIKAVTLANDVKEKKKMYAIINETLKCNFKKKKKKKKKKTVFPLNTIFIIQFNFY